MSKEQAELEVGSPAQSSIYGKQDEYPTAYNLEAPEYLPCNNRRRDSGINNSRRFNKITAAWIAALLLCCAAAAVATYFALDFRDQARNWYIYQVPPYAHDHQNIKS